MAGVAFGDEPSTDPAPVLEDTTTTTTTAPADTPSDPCAVDPEAEGCTVPAPDVPPEAASLDLGALDLGALEVGALADPGAANTVTVRPVVGAGDLAGTFTIRLQRCNVACGLDLAWSDVSTANVPSGSVHTFEGLVRSCGIFCVNQYRVVSSFESGYDLVSVTGAGCSGSSVAANVLFDIEGGQSFGAWTNGQSRDCTFTYSEYIVTVTKTVTGAPVGEPWSFPSRLASLDGYDETLAASDTEPTVEFRQVPLTLTGYALTESTPEGWRLTDVSCSGGGTSPWFELLPPRQSGVAFGGLFGNPTRSCTFTNSNNRVEVNKVVDPASFAGSFDIVLEKCEFNVLALCLGNWSEVDTKSVAGGSATAFNSLDGTYFDRYYRVTEVVPGGWTSEIDCTGGRQHSEDGAYAYFLFPLDLNAEAAVDCTVTNTAEPSSLTIAKTTDPSDGGPFDFTLGGPSIDPVDDFSLSDTDTESFADLDLGDYTLTETTAPLDEDWVFANLTCEVDGGNPDPVTPVSLGDGAWTIPLGPGQDVTCTADNREASLSLDITATPASGVVGDTITFEYEVTNTGKVPLTNVTVVSDLFGPITLGATDLGPGDSTTGTFDHTAVAGDVPQITDTATATADIDAGAIVLSDVGTQALDPVSVTATSEVTVGIAQVGGETVTVGGTGDGALPFTGSDSGSLLAAGLMVLLTGLALGALGWHRRRSVLDA
jgi:hypothetical protein